MTDGIQLQNEMLLVLLKNNEKIWNEMEEELLDYFTEEVMKNTENELFKEEYGGLLKNKIHCPSCESAKYVIWHGITPNGEDAHRKWFCTNCKTYFKEYLNEDRVEEYNGVEL